MPVVVNWSVPEVHGLLCKCACSQSALCESTGTSITTATIGNMCSLSCGDLAGAIKPLLSKASVQVAVLPCSSSVAIWPVPENHCFQEGICIDFMCSCFGNLVCARKPLLAAPVCAIELPHADRVVESDETNLQVRDRKSEFAPILRRPG